MNEVNQYMPGILGVCFLLAYIIYKYISRLHIFSVDDAKMFIKGTIFRLQGQGDKKYKVTRINIKKNQITCIEV